MSEGVGGVGEGKARGQEGEAHELKEGAHDEEEEPARTLKHALKKIDLSSNQWCLCVSGVEEGGREGGKE